MHLPISVQCLALSAGLASITLSSPAAASPAALDNSRRHQQQRRRGHRRRRRGGERRELKPEKSAHWGGGAHKEILSCPTELTNSVEIERDRATLYYALVPSDPPGADNGLLCGRLEAAVEAENGWIALGFSRHGRMIGSQSVIGIPEKGTVLKYHLFEEWVEGVVPMEGGRQTLRDTSVYYDDDEGRTVMEFAKLLVEDGEIPIAEEGTNVFIHARGYERLGYHYGERSFEKDFAEDVAGDILDVIEDASMDGTEMPTDIETDSPTETPTEEPTYLPERFYCVEDDDPECFDEDDYWYFYTELNRCDDKCKGKTKSCRSPVCPTTAPTASPFASEPPTVGVTTSPSTSVLPTPLPTLPPTLPSVTTPPEPAAEPTEPVMTSADATVETSADVTVETSADVTVETSADVMVETPSPSPGPTMDALHDDQEDAVATTTSSTTPPPEFTFTAQENEEDPTQSIPLTSFQLDFVLATTEFSSDEDGGRRRLASSSQDEYLLFQMAQDVELLSLVSSHLVEQFRKNSDGGLINVVLGVGNKEETVEDTTTEVVMASYDFFGYALYTAGDEDSESLPTAADLDDQVLLAFNTRKGKRAFMNALEYSDDNVLKKIETVVASSSSIVGNELDPSKATENDNEGTVNDGVVSSKSEAASLAVPFVVLIASAIATTFLVLGLLTFRKYKQYQENNGWNDYLSYQHRKRKITIDTNSKKLKQYAHFESPEGSVADASGSEDAIYDLEIVGGNTPTKYSDADSTIPGQQFPPASDAANNSAESKPYDESSRTAAYDMTYFSHAANQMNGIMMDQSRIDGYETGYETEGLEQSRVEGGCDETLEGLYSDKDSYFQSTIGGAPSVAGQHRRGDSIHSLDTLDNTFGNGNDGPVSHLIDGIDRMIDASNGGADVSMMEGPEHDLESPLFSPIEHSSHCRGISDADNIVTETTRILLESHDITHVSDDTDNANEVYEDKPEEEVVKRHCNDDILNWKFDNNIANTSSDRDEDAEAGASQVNQGNGNDSKDSEVVTVDCLESPDNDTSMISTTDELYARITELEKKILNTESQLAKDDVVLGTPSKLEEIVTKSPPPASTPFPTNSAEEGRTFVSSEALPATEQLPSSSIQKGIFTEETLGMIERSRLSGTPPPSEGEVDNEMIREAKENSLLGKSLSGDQTDSEEGEDSVLELV